MKYTVVIRQPVPDEVRPNLEKELVERFGLNEQQAERLAGRRTGRLLKPTTQARADLLLRVYQSVGAQVLLEEIPEESGTPSQAFRAAPAAVDDAVLAPPLQNNVSLSEFSMAGGGSADAFSAAGTFMPSDDPFAATFAPAADPSSSTASPSPAPGGEPLPEWAVRDPNLAPDHNPAVNLLGGLTPAAGVALSSAASPSEAAIARELQSATTPKAPTTKTPVADDWADFAGGLNLPETAAPDRSSAPRATTEFLTAVTEEAPARVLPRTSVASQIRWGTLLPVALSSLLTLGLLALSLPSQQNRVIQGTARNLAAMIGGNLDDSIQAVNEFQLKALVDNPEVSFVRVEQGNRSYVRSKDAAQNDALNTTLANWTKSSPDAGRLKVGGETYMVSRVALVQTADGMVTPASSAANPGGTVERYVSVGMSTRDSAAALRNLLLLTLLSTLIGLGIASLLARQAARRIVQPISDLVKVADAISLGDLNRPVKATSNDELGDLAQALERMRLSLEAAMDRLRRRKRG